MHSEPASTQEIAQGIVAGPDEARLAPQQGDLLSLPFDQYSRMRIAENVLLALYSEFAQRTTKNGNGDRPPHLRVLDVGGFPGVLRNFLSSEAYELTVVDVVPDDGTIPNYLQGSGLELPFDADSFDVVTALDTLEHIPWANRDRFLSELKRVARQAVVLINPIQSLEADLAEETLNEYIRWLLDAQQEQLAEHRAYGLPDFPATIASFEQDGWQTIHFPTANIHNWLLMMVAKHYLISLRTEQAASFERTLDRFYNLSFTTPDRAEPGYRGVLVAVRQPLQGALHRIEEIYPPAPATEESNAVRLQLAQLLMSMLNLKTANHEDRLLREQMEHKDRHISGMEARLAILDIQLDQRRAQIEQYQAQVDQGAAQVVAVQKELRARSEHVTNLELLMAQEREAHTAEFSRQQKYMSRLQDEMKAKDEHIRYLENLLQGIEAGRVMRLLRTISRYLGRK